MSDFPDKQDPDSPVGPAEGSASDSSTKPASEAVQDEVTPEKSRAQPNGRLQIDVRALLASARSETGALERLSTGDPLGLSPKTVRWSRENGILLDPDRVLLRALAEVVSCALPPREHPIEEWLDERIEDAVDALLEDDVRSSRADGRNASTPEHGFLSQVFAIAPESALSASVRFHALPRRARRAFVALFIDERSVADCIEYELGTLESLRADGRAGLAAITGRSPERKNRVTQSSEEGS